MDMNELIVKNFKKVEMSIISLAEEKGRFKGFPEKTEQNLVYYDALVMKFELVLEIVCNIFFRVVEMAEFGVLSPEINDCIAKMKQLSLISSEELWYGMIMKRSNLSSTLENKARASLCNEILTVYTDELEMLCVCAKQRYGIPAQGQ
ncbi:MAG: nucleotidyltransferase substrate binding protein [Spirochaetales bacterium]|nr:nucleotidyltransferase substrate binding protein [Spirochaetales bacterium]